MLAMLNDYNNITKYYVRRVSRVTSELRTREIKRTYFEDFFDGSAQELRYPVISTG
jgi:hypothetical protein